MESLALDLRRSDMEPRGPAVGLVIACSVLPIIGMLACAARLPPTPEQDLAAHINEYLELRAQAVDRVGRLRPGADARRLPREVDALSAEIQALRRGLPPGVLFSGRVRTDIRKALAQRLAEPDGPALRAVIGEVQPADTHIDVNMRYPEAQPRSTVPPSILAVLPSLPRELEYRFVGRDLLILDRNTAVVLDVMRDALPPAG